MGNRLKIPRRDNQGMTPPMQLLCSMLATSTDEGERAVLQGKLHQILAWNAGRDQVRGMWVVRK